MNFAASQSCLGCIGFGSLEQDCLSSGSHCLGRGHVVTAVPWFLPWVPAVPTVVPYWHAVGMGFRLPTQYNQQRNIPRR